MKDMQEPALVDRVQALIGHLQQWRPEIERCLVYADGSHTYDDVCQMVLSGRVQFFNFPQAFAIMEYKEYPRQKAYHCFMAGGDLNSVLECQYAIIEVAKMAGCNTVTLCGRPGWERAFKPHGWGAQCTMLSKRIDGGEDV